MRPTTPPPMRTWENLLALVAALFVAGALLPWSLRLACAVAAIGIVLLLGALRLRAHAMTVTRARTDDVYGKIKRIRDAREKGRGAKR